MTSTGGVRPTKRCLDDLGLAFPTMDTPLHTLASPVVDKAQRLPQTLEANAAERVLFATDRVWFKVKVDDDRSMATQLTDEDVTTLRFLGAGGSDLPGLELLAETRWWMGPAGKRQSGSPRDFYTSVEAEVAREGRGSGEVSTRHLLPQAIDIKRLAAEPALLVAERVRELVRGAIARSLRSSHICGVTILHQGIPKHDLSAHVRASDGDAYLTIRAQGFPDGRIIALILDSVPGIPAGDWMAEPKGALGIKPGVGELVYSTIIPPESQRAVLEEYPDDDA